MIKWLVLSFYVGVIFTFIVFYIGHRWYEFRKTHGFLDD